MHLAALAASLAAVLAAVLAALQAAVYPALAMCCWHPLPACEQVWAM